MISTLEAVNGGTSRDTSFKVRSCHTKLEWALPYITWKELIFNSFYLEEGVVILKELIFNSFYFGWVWWS